MCYKNLKGKKKNVLSLFYIICIQRLFMCGRSTALIIIYALLLYNTHVIV
jgi:hypothetical protein